jgi:hypothetical protein
MFIYLEAHLRPSRHSRKYRLSRLVASQNAADGKTKEIQHKPISWCNAIEMIVYFMPNLVLFQKLTLLIKMY